MKYISLKHAETSVRLHKNDIDWPLFVSEWPFGWSASITLNDDNGILVARFHDLYFEHHLPQTTRLYFYHHFSLERFDPFIHFAAFMIYNSENIWTKTPLARVRRYLLKYQSVFLNYYLKIGS